MRIVRALFSAPDFPNGSQDFFFIDDDKAEKWAKNLPLIRKHLPFSSLLKNNGISLHNCRENEIGYYEIAEELWKSSNE
jgi:hypothetical protein